MSESLVFDVSSSSPVMLAENHMIEQQNKIISLPEKEKEYVVSLLTKHSKVVVVSSIDEMDQAISKLNADGYKLDRKYLGSSTWVVFSIGKY